MPIITGNPFFLAVDEMMGESQGTPYIMGGDRTYTRKFLVQTLQPGMAPLQVAYAPGLPIDGALYVTPYTYDLLAILIKREAVPQTKNDWRNWIVTQEYSTRLQKTKQDDPKSQNQPELERPDVEWDFETVKLSFQRDIAGNAFLNSANMPFSPPPTFDCAVPVLLITRNELTFNVTLAQQYSYALNLTSFLGYPQDMVQCMPPKAKQMWKGSYRFWKINYKLRFAPTVYNPAFNPMLPDDPVTNPPFIYVPWQPRLLDQGMYHLDPDSGSPTFNKPVPIWKGLGPLHHPVLLNGAGQEAPETPPVPRYIDFTVYNELNFNTLLVQGLSG